MPEKDVLAPSSHNRVVAKGIRRTDTEVKPTTITSMSVRVLSAAEVEVVASVSGSVVSGETDSWAAELDTSAGESGALSNGTDYIVEVTIVADSKTRIKYKQVRASYD